MAQIALSLLFIVSPLLGGELDQKKPTWGSDCLARVQSLFYKAPIKNKTRSIQEILSNTALLNRLLRDKDPYWDGVISHIAELPREGSGSVVLKDQNRSLILSVQFQPDNSAVVTVDSFSLNGIQQGKRPEGISFEFGRLVASIYEGIREREAKTGEKTEHVAVIAGVVVNKQLATALRDLGFKQSPLDHFFSKWGYWVGVPLIISVYTVPKLFPSIAPMVKQGAFLIGVFSTALGYRGRNSSWHLDLDVPDAGK